MCVVWGLIRVGIGWRDRKTYRQMVPICPAVERPSHRSFVLRRLQMNALALM